MNSISYEIEMLMNELSEEHRKRGLINFISDGAVNSDLYERSHPKVAFFLKEAYSKKEVGDWNLCEWLNNGNMTRMWSAVAEWTYGIKNTTLTNIPPKPQLSSEEKTDLLRTVAVVNVKKSNGKISSEYLDLLGYAKEDSAFLKKELDILSPDIIVCGNNSSLLRLLYGANVSSGKVLSDGLIDGEFMKRNGYAFLGSQIVIDYYHPANQYPSMLNYYTVCSLYQQAIKMKG